MKEIASKSGVWEFGKEFKDKWFAKGARQKRMAKYIDESISALRADLIAMVTGQPTTEEH